MPSWGVLVSRVAFLVILADPARCQVAPRDGSSSQIRKDWALGQHLAQDLERRDGRIDNPAIAGYLQRIENQMALGIGGKPLEVRATRGSDRYAFLLPHDVLYLSGSLLERIENEAELAGLLAHQLAHARVDRIATAPRQGLEVSLPKCVLASPFTFGRIVEMRESELKATAAAVKNLKAAGYEPSAILDLLSKLVYEHPVWATAIPPEDLLKLRAMLEPDTPPAKGYLIDSSEFMQQRAMLVTALGHAARNMRPPSLMSARSR
jgi:predicted Zn-dependent protease